MQLWVPPLIITISFSLFPFGFNHHILHHQCPNIPLSTWRPSNLINFWFLFFCFLVKMQCNRLARSVPSHLQGTATKRPWNIVSKRIWTLCFYSSQNKMYISIYIYIHIYYNFLDLSSLIKLSKWRLISQLSGKFIYLFFNKSLEYKSPIFNTKKWKRVGVNDTIIGSTLYEIMQKSNVAKIIFFFF